MLCKYTCLYIYTRVHVAHTSPTVFPARHVTPLREFSRAPCHGRILTAPFFCVQAALRMARLCHGERPTREMGPGNPQHPFSPYVATPYLPYVKKNNVRFALFFSGATSVGRRSAGSSSRLGLLRSRPSARWAFDDSLS